MTTQQENMEMAVKHLMWSMGNVNMADVPKFMKFCPHWLFPNMRSKTEALGAITMMVDRIKTLMDLERQVGREQSAFGLFIKLAALSLQAAVDIEMTEEAEAAKKLEGFDYVI